MHRVAVVRPFAQLLTRIGAPVERYFRQAGLPFAALEDADNYVPSERFLAFVVNAAQREGIEALGFRVGQEHGANCADPRFSKVLRGLPTLYRGVLHASELTNKTVYRSRMGLMQPPGSEHVRYYHHPSCGAQHPAVHQIGWFGLMTLVGVVRTYAGPRWQPSEIGVMTPTPPCHHIREQFANARIRLSQPYSYVTVDTALLSLPPYTTSTATPTSSSPLYEPISHDLIGSLKQLFRTYIQESELTIEAAAEICHVSPRTLQRILAEMGTRYSAVVDEVRFAVASRMLQQPDMTVTDVAHLLGYSNATHFSRSFRRMAGISPRAYREARG
jgi:AraC-like DNA-binding protein